MIITLAAGLRTNICNSKVWLNPDNSSEESHENKGKKKDKEFFAQLAAKKTPDLVFLFLLRNFN